MNTETLEQPRPIWRGTFDVRHKRTAAQSTPLSREQREAERLRKLSEKLAELQELLKPIDE